MPETLNIITTAKRQDRYDELQIQLQSQKIADVKYWEGEVFKHSPKKGICRAHKRIVQDAKDNGDEKCVIGENDLQFTSVGAWKYFLDSVPNDFDTFSGLVYVGDIEDNRIISQASGMTTLYAVHERFYDFFLSIPDDCHIDRDYH